jgi:hypothetical protein
MLIQSRLKALLLCVFAALTHVASAQVVRKELSVPASSIDTRAWQPQVVLRHQGNVEPPENPVMPPVVTGKKHDLPVGKVDASAASVTPGKNSQVFQVPDGIRPTVTLPLDKTILLKL